MKEFTVNENSTGIRLDKFMSSVMPNVGFGEICKGLRKKKVRVNGKHQSGTYRLQKGDIIQIYMNDDMFVSQNTNENITGNTTNKITYDWMKCSDKIDVVYEDENILIADKPSGLRSQDGGGDRDSLESRIRSYLYKKGEINLNEVPLFIPSLCHRIDRNTSGLVIAAKNGETLRSVNKLIKEKQIRKFYLCATENKPPKKNGEISGWLVKNGKDRKMIFHTSKPNDKNAEYCQTLYRVITSKSPYISEAELLTGKTHQIRAGFASMGCPLVGDVKYGAKKTADKEYQYLTAYKLVFDYEPFGNLLDYLSKKEFAISD